MNTAIKYLLLAIVVFGVIQCDTRKAKPKAYQGKDVDFDIFQRCNGRTSSGLNYDCVSNDLNKVSCKFSVVKERSTDGKYHAKTISYEDMPSVLRDISNKKIDMMA